MTRCCTAILQLADFNVYSHHRRENIRRQCDYVSRGRMLPLSLVTNDKFRRIVYCKTRPNERGNANTQFAIKGEKETFYPT